MTKQEIKNRAIKRANNILNLRRTKTLKEIGIIYNITPERVRYLVATALLRKSGKYYL